ncbi:MAG: LptE family protein [Nitrospirota bacterium]
MDQSPGSSTVRPKACSPLLLTSCFLLLAFFLYGCGYTLHTRAQLPFDTIAVGRIENKTFEPKLQDRFNRVLVDTFAEYGYRLSPSARYLLEGEIAEFELTPRSEQALVATQYEVIIRAAFRLIDRETGRAIPLVAGSPFITYFSTTGKLENVLAQKEVSTVSAMRNLSQELVRQITYTTPQNFASLLFTADTIRDADRFARRLRDAGDPLSRYLYGRLSPDTRRLLSEAGSTRASDKEFFERLKTALANELNQVVQGLSLYDEERFAHLQLSAEARRLVEQQPTGIERMRLNRLLLEEAYPAELARSSEQR